MFSWRNTPNSQSISEFVSSWCCWSMSEYQKNAGRKSELVVFPPLRVVCGSSKFDQLFHNNQWITERKCRNYSPQRVRLVEFGDVFVALELDWKSCWKMRLIYRKLRHISPFWFVRERWGHFWGANCGNWPLSSIISILGSWNSSMCRLVC